MTIVTIIKRFGVTIGTTAALAAPMAVSAQSGTSGEAIAVRVPAELCTVDARYRTNLYKALAGRSDFGALLDHMFENCPELALGLADYGTAAIEPRTDRRGDDRVGPERGPKSQKSPRDDQPGDDEASDDDKDEPGVSDEEREREEKARDEREREEKAREERERRERAREEYREEQRRAREERREQQQRAREERREERQRAREEARREKEELKARL